MAILEYICTISITSPPYKKGKKKKKAKTLKKCDSLLAGANFALLSVFHEYQLIYSCDIRVTSMKTFVIMIQGRV